MKKIYIKVILTSFALLVYSNLIAQNLEWAKVFDSTHYSYCTDTDVDCQGNVYSTGYFNGFCDFDPAIESYHFLYCNEGEGDIYISKLNLNGNLEWVLSFGSQHPFGESGYSIKTDANDDIIVAGSFHDSVDFDPSENVYNLTAFNSYGNFICKYNSNGNLIWAKQFSSIENTSISELQVKNSFIYITGSMQGTIDFDTSENTYFLTSNGYYDIFFAKYDINGNLVWAKNLGSTGNDGGESIAVDDDNNVYVTGSFWSTVDFDSSPNNYNLTSAGLSDIFIAKFNSIGNLDWAKRMGGNTWGDSGQSIALDREQNIYLTGGFNGVSDFDPSSSSFLITSYGETDVFIAKYDNLCNLLWVKRVGGNQYDYGLSIAYDNLTESIFTTGSFTGQADFDPSDNNNILISNGGHDVFVQKWDVDGNMIWVGKFGGTTGENYSSEYGKKVVVDEYSNLYLGGLFEGSADFDITINDYIYTSENFYEKAFICKYSDNSLNNESENNIIDHFVFYPNPTENEMTINVNLPTHINIYDKLGKLLFSEYTDHKINIDVSNFKSGVYLIQIENDRIKVNEKFLKI